MDLLDKIIKHNQNGDNFFAGGLSQIESEGELKVDVYQKDNNVVIKSTIAGAKPEDIGISINNDILTIRGKRHMDEKVDAKNYIHRECYWGAFSRSIILPCETNKGRIKAIIKRGVLTIILPKTEKNKEIKVKELEE
jgi:HSP20 family protein